MRQLIIKMKNLTSKNHLKVYSQGMVCHETYKDENNNWLSLDEGKNK